jgi:hypothetical protein
VYSRATNGLISILLWLPAKQRETATKEKYGDDIQTIVRSLMHANGKAWTKCLKDTVWWISIPILAVDALDHHILAGCLFDVFNFGINHVSSLSTRTKR